MPDIQLVTSFFLDQIAFKTPAPALTAQVNCAYAYAAASHAAAWLAEHFQKQNALKEGLQ
ncbi:hypothetical protein [Desulfocurvibacter africanus]|uniref:hypothetical protein n=1 Tax=Desulfocurvibacter africanus TaxID=873 RepID=UPI001182F30E|nr:hypothetical protein [Desulfocurvibacter africanus]